MSLSYAVFYSPTVKQGAQLTLLKEAFTDIGLLATFHPIQDCNKLSSKLNADIMVAAGGDGTVNGVASLAYRLNKPLGVVPLGTLNHFAKDIGLPLVLLQAVEVLAKYHTIKIDIGMVNGHIFMNNCSIGLYPTIVRSRTHLEKYIGKRLAVLASIFLVVSRLRRLYTIKMILNSDRKTIERKSSLLFVGNNSYSLKGLGLPNRDNLWNGKLHVFILKTKRMDRLIKTALYSFLGKRLPEHYIERYESKNLKVVVGTQKQAWVAYDGEVGKISTPIEFKLLPKALSVITNKQDK